MNMPGPGRRDRSFRAFPPGEIADKHFAHKRAVVLESVIGEWRCIGQQWAFPVDLP